MLLRPPARVFFAAVVTLAISGAQVQNQSGLRGRVVDKFERVPIANVFVLVHGRTGDDMNVRTDRAGIYEIRLPPGIYDVLISAGGFSPACRKIEVNAQKTTRFDVILEANTLNGMEAERTAEPTIGATSP